MKLKSFIFFLFFALPVNLLAQKITGQVINEFDNTPIFGVTIYSDGVPFAFSDQDGEFEIEDSSEIKALTFSHLAFTEKTLKTSEFKNENQIVYLAEKATMLREVEIITLKNPLTLEDIVKKSSKKFIECYKTTPYLTTINAKEIVMQNNEYMGYVEIEGILYNFIPKDRNPFKYSFVLPLEIRKSKEKTELSDYSSKNKLPYNTSCTDLLRASFLDVQFSNVSHPLIKKQKYTFKRLEDIEIDGNEYYQIQFFQKKGIKAKIDLFNVYGEMLISKEDFSIVKHKVSFDFDNINSNEIEILYAKKGVAILPSIIKVNTKIINSKYKKKGVYKQIVFNIDNSKTIDTKDITEKVAFNLNYYLDEVKYDANYWKQKSQNSSTELIDKYLKTLSEQDFQDGAKQKVLDINSKYYTKEHENFRVYQIKLHEETLKNIKL